MIIFDNVGRDDFDGVAGFALVGGGVLGDECFVLIPSVVGVVVGDSFLLGFADDTFVGS